MSAWSIPPIAIAGITFYVGLYHLSIYVRRKQHREDLSFALMCLAASFYSAFCAGLYSSVSVQEGAQWQRVQFISLAVFMSAFLWFSSDYTHQKPQVMTYAMWAFYLAAIVIQAVDRTSLTWLMDAASIKTISLPFGATITYYEATLGPFTAFQGVMGLVAGVQILWDGVRFYMDGYTREARPLLVALGLMYAAGVNDTAVSNSLYHFVYVLEYVYLAMIVLMTYSLSGTVVEAAMTKEALEKSEERLKLAMEATSDGLFDWDVKTNEVFLSPRVYTMLGYEPYELPQLAETWVSLVHPDDRQAIINLVQEYGEGQRQSHELETRLRAKSGEWRWVLSRGKIVEKRVDGVPGRLVGTHSDITQRKQAEQTLRRAKLIVEGGPVVLFGWQPVEGWPVDYVSDNVTGQLGYSPEEFVSGTIPFVSILHPDDRGRVADEVREYSIHGADSFKQEYRIITKNGDVRWFDDRTIVQRDAKGQITRYEGLVIDITDRKKAEEALRESETLFRTLVENSPVGIFQVDDSYRFVYANDEMGRVLGYGPDEIVDMDFRDALDNQSRELVTDRYIRRQRGEELPSRYEIGIVRKDGAKRRAELIAAAVTDAQGKVKTIGQLIDVTEHKQAEAALRESREMLRLVLDSIPVRVFWKDKESVFLGCNHPFASDAGLASPDDIIGKNDHILPWVEQADLYRSDDRLVMETGTPKMGYEEPQGEPGSQLRWLRTSKVPLRDAQGNVVGILGTYEDITESKHQARLLQESEDRLLKAQAIAHVGSWEIDIGSQTMWGSDEALRIYGVDQSIHVLPLQVVQDCALPEYRPALDKAIRDLIAGRRGYAIDFQIRRNSDGQVRYVHSTAELVHDETGRPVKIVGVVQDITERKQLEQDLQMFRFSIDQASDAIFWHKRNSGVEYVNEQACRSLGYSREELMRLHLSDYDPIFPKEQWDREWRRMHANRRGGSMHMETFHRRKDGTDFPVEVSSKHLWFGDKELHVAVVRDITERKQAEEALQESQGNLQTLFDTLSDFLLILDPEGQIVHFNPVVLKRLGYSAEELQGKKLVELHPPDRRQEAVAIMADMLAGKKTTCPIPLMTKEGALIPVDTVVSRGTWSGSDALFGISRDITALKTMEQREQLAYEVGRQLTRLLDLNTLLAETILRLQETFGYYHVQIYLLDTAQQILSLRVATGEVGAQLIRQGHSIPLDAERSLVAHAARTSVPVVAADALTHPSYLPNPLLADTRSEVALSLSLGGKVLGVLDVQHDVIGHFDEAETRTLQIVASQISVALSNAQLFEEVRSLNEDLELRVHDRTAQLEAANKELEAFSYSVSHDLRAPLRSIDGFSQALLEDYTQLLDQEGQEHLWRVRAASQRMGQLIDDLLMLSRIARQELRHEVVDLSKMAHEIVAELRQAEPERSVELTVAEGMTTSGDPSLLRISLSNMLANAWKFTSTRPQATIRFYDVLQSGERVFAIQDNGAGFDMKYADKLFGAFQRLHPRSEYEGTGIGLATVQRIIHRHGGRIWAEAAVEKGATFYFTVPGS